MIDAPQIPFGYKLIHGPSQKGDGIWNGVVCQSQEVLADERAQRDNQKMRGQPAGADL